MSTPESAAEYLSRINWKSLVEWLTAETILCRPQDPVSYCRDLLSQQIKTRRGTFQPQQLTEKLQDCYNEAVALVNDQGVIPQKSTADRAKDEVDFLRERLVISERLLEAARAMSTKLDPLEATENITYQACQVLSTDRATIFTVDSHTNELVLYVAQGANDIRIPMGVGIAGSVAATGRLINVIDAYEDPRFDQEIDRKTGYKTDSILCGPIRGRTGEVIGVLQAINKKSGKFTVFDEDILENLAAQAGIILQNSMLFQEAERSRDQFRSLLEIVRALQSDLGANSLIFTMTQRTPRIVGADRCTLYLVDNGTEGLYAMQGEVNIKIPMSKGIAGAVATNREIINIPNAYEDSRFDPDVDRKTSYTTKNMLAMPIIFQHEVVGVFQLINKEAGPFTNEDTEMMKMFLCIAAPILRSSHLYESLQGKPGVKDKMVERSANSPVERKRATWQHPVLSQVAESEGDEDEDEDDEQGEHTET